MRPLALEPNYRHAHFVAPPATRLTRDTAPAAYEKLKNFLAIQTTQLPPAGGWPVKSADWERHLFHPTGWHHRVKWYPVLQPGWRQLHYDEFLAWYGIEKWAEVSP